MKTLIRNLVNSPLINPIVLHGLYSLGLKGQWVRERFYRVGVISRQDLKMIGEIWEPVASDVFWGGKFGFEKEMSIVFSNDINENSTVLDIGAYTGYYSLVSAHKGARVFAFEPSCQTRKMLFRNIALNRVDVTVIPVALSDKDGYAELYTPTGTIDSGASLDGKYGGTREETRLTTLDAFVEFYGIQSIDVVKIDVERHEPQVLKGGADTSARFRPIIYIEILRDTDTSTIEECLRGYKFEMLTNDGPELRSNIVADEKWRNYRCVPE